MKLYICSHIINNQKIKKRHTTYELFSCSMRYLNVSINSSTLSRIQKDWINRMGFWAAALCFFKKKRYKQIQKKKKQETKTQIPRLFIYLISGSFDIASISRTCRGVNDSEGRFRSDMLEYSVGLFTSIRYYTHIHTHTNVPTGTKNGNQHLFIK